MGVANRSTNSSSSMNSNRMTSSAHMVRRKNVEQKPTYETISLESWISHYHSEEDMREVFLNMDRAMKYVHDHGYCIKSFHPKDIEIINQQFDQIRFKTLLEMPFDPVERKQYVKEDIYNSSFLQIGIYTKCLYYLKRDYLKANYADFSQFLPEGDVPYYRGVVERGASVYFCEYDLEKRKRDLMNLEKEVGDGNVPTDKSALNSLDVNEEINSVIYRQISKKNEAAYINFLVYPTIMFAISIIIALIVRILSFI